MNAPVSEDSDGPAGRGPDQTSGPSGSSSSVKGFDPTTTACANCVIDFPISPIMVIHYMLFAAYD